MLGQIEDTRIINGSSFFCADEFAFINLHSLTSLMLGDLTFMSAKSFLIKSTSEIASYSSHSRFDQFDPSQTRPFRIPQRANRNILPFLSFYSLSHLPDLPVLSNCTLEEAFIGCKELTLLSCFFLPLSSFQTFLILTPSRRTTPSTSLPSSPQSSSTAAGNSNRSAAVSIP